jgi:predicted secreted protein
MKVGTEQVRVKTIRMNTGARPPYPTPLKCNQVTKIDGVKERAEINLRGKASLSIELTVEDFSKP